MCNHSKIITRKELNGKVVVVNFTGTFISKSECDEIGDEFACLVGYDGCVNIILDFAGLTGVNIDIYGKFYTLHKTCKANSGRLILCGFDENVSDNFRVSGMTKHFTIVDTLQEALAMFS